MSAPSDRERRLTEAALHLNARFLDEVVERWNICPWAAPSRESGEVERHVVLGELLVDGEVSTAVRELVERIERRSKIIVSLLIFPNETSSAPQWTTGVEQLRATFLQGPGRERILAAAPFHPELPFETGTPAALVPLFRRSPDPTIQLVRLDTLKDIADKGGGEDRYASPDEVQRILRGEVKPRKSISDKVAEHNKATLDGIGVKTLLDVLDDIARERARLYSELG